VVLGFARDSSEPAPPVVGETRSIAAWLREHPEVSIVLDGHADAVGSTDRNLALSHERAQRVAAILRRAGVTASRLTARGFGAYQPLEGAAGDGPAQRRVEVHFRGAAACYRDTRQVVIP
jgi:outer membrane protein OmpA-like peptidoglycan-associated protein